MSLGPEINLSAEDVEKAVKSLSEFIKFDTVSGTGPEGPYDKCVAYLRSQCEELDLDCQILSESLPGKPLFVATWAGEDDSLPCLILNSHYDVVPVIAESWTVPAFAGLRKDGRIYGRGTQDMKCVCIQYIEAVRQLKKNGFSPRRSMHLTFVPDEEIGGVEGMCILLQSEWYTNIKQGPGVALALDEGLASEDDDYSVFYGERLPWWVRVHAEGATGHGSRFIDGTAVEAIVRVVNEALRFRSEQRALLHGGGCAHGCDHSVAAKSTLGDVTTLNVTRVHAGISSGGKPVLNVIPSEAEACFDIRITPHTDPHDIKDMLDAWCKTENAANNSAKTPSARVSWEWINPGALQHATTTVDQANPWWVLFKATLVDKCKVNLKPQVFPAATDSRFLRAEGVRALGFSPMRRSPILLHEHDEYIDEAVFVEGVQVYVILLEALGSTDV
jgi:aminoacylase